MKAAHVNENAMAEALKFMALAGHGLAWLPESLITRELAEGSLVASGSGAALEIRLYRNAGRRHPALDAVWQAAGALASEAAETGFPKGQPFGGVSGQRPDDAGPA
jgi:DNA-binding transcriptional LysR family regulator